MRVIARALLVMSFFTVPLVAFERDCPTVADRGKRLLSPQTPVEVVALYESFALLGRYEQQSLIEHSVLPSGKLCGLTTCVSTGVPIRR